MPGFNVNPIGGGLNSNAPSNTVEIRRNYRWVFESLGRGAGTFSPTELLLLQSASRPKVKIDAKDVHHNQEVVYLAAKQQWDPINLKWYDSEQNPDISRALYTWLETVINLRSMNVAHPANYKRQGTLAVLDGAGRATERWVMYGTWPETVNWGELNYTGTDLLVCESTMRYDRAIKTCDRAQGQATVTPSC